MNEINMLTFISCINNCLIINTFSLILTYSLPINVSINKAFHQHLFGFDVVGVWVSLDDISFSVLLLPSAQFSYVFQAHRCCCFCKCKAHHLLCTGVFLGKRTDTECPESLHELGFNSAIGVLYRSEMEGDKTDVY